MITTGIYLTNCSAAFIASNISTLGALLLGGNKILKHKQQMRILSKIDMLGTTQVGYKLKYIAYILNLLRGVRDLWEKFNDFIETTIKAHD